MSESIIYLFLFVFRTYHVLIWLLFQVREAVNILDLDVIFYPCPRGGPTFRQKVLQMGGKQQFPYMIDPNTNTAIYESDDIIQVMYYFECR